MNQEQKLQAVKLLIVGIMSNKTRQDVEKELIELGLTKKETLEQLDDGLNAVKQAGAPQDLIDNFFFNDKIEKEVAYFEVPVGAEDLFLCSDNECPCTDRKRLKPGIDGYLYISPELVEMRRDCISWEAAQSKLIKNQTGLMSVSNGVINPIFMCEIGAKKRSIDLEISKSDAKYWADKGMVPLRPTPISKKSAVQSNDAIDFVRVRPTPEAEKSLMQSLKKITSQAKNISKPDDRTADTLLIIFIIIAFISGIAQFSIQKLDTNWYEGATKYILGGFWILQNLSFMLIAIAIKNKPLKIAGIIIAVLLVSSWLYKNIVFLIG